MLRASSLGLQLLRRSQRSLSVISFAQKHAGQSCIPDATLEAPVASAGHLSRHAHSEPSSGNVHESPPQILLAGTSEALHATTTTTDSDVQLEPDVLDFESEARERPALVYTHHKPPPLRFAFQSCRAPDWWNHSDGTDTTRFAREQTPPTQDELFSAAPVDPRPQLRRVLATSMSLPDVWDAYHALLALPVPKRVAEGSTVRIPAALLHRVATMLASAKPRTRTTFLRLLSVLTTLRNVGGHLYEWEWNALMHLAGRGWRRVRPQDYQNTMRLYNDFCAGRAPGSASLPRRPRADEDEGEEDMEEEEDTYHRDIAKPDIVSYTTIIGIAARTGSVSAVRHATNLLRVSGMAPSRLTHLALLRHFARSHDLSGLRDTLVKMAHQGHPLGVDGLNAIAWTYARCGRLDVAGTIYRVLRHNVVSEAEEDNGADDIQTARTYLADVERIQIPTDAIPDATTYTLIIQACAYSGDLTRALRVFIDMLTTLNLDDLPAAVDRQAGTAERANYEATLPIFRALFLGFVRHSAHPPNTGRRHDLGVAELRRLVSRTNAPLPLPYSTTSPWTLDRLQPLFDHFLGLPPDTRPSERLIYWLLLAFAKTSNYDMDLLRDVWKQLTQRFGGRWGGRIEQYRQALFSDVPRSPYDNRYR